MPDSENLKILKQRIAEELSSDESGSGMSDDEIELTIWKKLNSSVRCAGLGFSDKLAAAVEIYSNMRGCGALDPLLADDNVSEIMVNGPDSVYVEIDGALRKTDVRFEDEGKLCDVIRRIVSLGGREVNTANPIVDTRLPDGSRVNAVLPPLSLSGPILTIRRFPKDALDFGKMISLGTVTEEAAEFLKKAVISGCNVIISGGTGSGKTTFLNALTDFIPSDERIVTIEDSAELKIRSCANLVRLEARNANSSGAGRITIRELIRTSLRMRPDRIIVGEVRGAEAIDMLQAMNTGHDGSISTGHANSSADMLSRLETMALEGNPGLPLAAIRSQIASAVDYCVHLSRMRDNSRKVLEINEIAGLRDGGIVLNPVFTYVQASDGSGGLERTHNPIINTQKFERHGYGDLL